MRGRDWLVLAGFIAVCLGIGALGGFATASSTRDWYPTLAKPSFNPPSWLFGPVWTALYVMIGVSGFLTWRATPRDPRWRRAMIAFAVQLALNAAWSPAFFGLRSPLAGLLVIVPLLAMIVVTIAWQWRVSRPAAALMLPYLAWVAFATLLNASIVALN